MRSLFPEYTAASLYDAAIHFRDTADKRHQERLAELRVQVRAEIGRQFEPSDLLDTIGKVRHVYDAAGKLSWTEQTWRKMVDVTAQSLALPEADALRACGILVATNFIFEEQTAMVILACACLESVLSRLLVRVAEQQGASADEAEETVDKIKNFTSKKRKDPNTLLGFFCDKTQVTLEQALDQLGHRDFWDGWSQSREDRNAILHGKFPFAPADTRETVLGLLAETIPVFAELHNRYGAKSPQP